MWPEFPRKQELANGRWWTATFDSYDQYRELGYYLVRLFDGYDLVDKFMVWVDTDSIDHDTVPELTTRLAALAAAGTSNTDWQGTRWRDACSICEQLPPSLEASDTEYKPFPDLVYSLKPRAKRSGSAGSVVVDLWECPECGLLYAYSIFVDFTGFMKGGDSDRETLERLSLEQTALVRAILACEADPAATQETLFALPAVAVRAALEGAYARDRDFVALFIPRLVHALAARTHAIDDLLHALVEDKPSFAREVLASTTGLPAELRARRHVHDLEEHCKRALA
jgi:hypothetical protein